MSLRVMHVVDRMDRETGGPAASLVRMADALTRHGASVSVLVARTTGDLLHPAEAVTVHIGPADLDARVEEADIVHVHGVWDPIIHRVCTRCRVSRRPFIIRTCGMLDPWCLAHGRLKKRLYRALRLDTHLNAAAALHCTSDTEAAHVRELADGRPVIVEPNGIESGQVGAATAGSFRERVGVGDRPIVLFLGRLHPIKGLDELLAAFGQMASNAALVLAGPDEDGHRAHLERTADAGGLADRVVFTGMLDASARNAALHDADLFVLPSHHENFGVAAAEAMAAGTPVIVSDQVNIEGDIRAADAGAVVPAHDPAALAAAIDDWLADPDRRRLAGEAGRVFAREHYDWDRIAVRWIGHYRRLAAEPGV